MKRIILAFLVLLSAVGGLVADDRFPGGEPIHAPRELPTVEVVGKLTQLTVGWYLNLGEDEHGSSIMMKLEFMDKDIKTAEKLEYKQVRLTIRQPEGRKISVIVEKIQEIKP